MGWHLAWNGLAVGALAAMLGVASAGSEPCPSQCNSGKVHLGISAPLTGPHARLGRQTVLGAETAVSEINAKGELNGFPVELVAVDDRCDPGLVVDAARRLVARGTIKFVIGPTCPPAAMAAAPILAEADVVQFMPTLTEVGITWRVPGHFFRIAQTDEQAAQALAAHLAREYQGKKVTVVYTDTFYMRPLIEMVRAGLPAHANMPVRFETLLDATGAAERLVRVLRRDPPDLIYMVINSELVVQLISLLRESGIAATLMGGQRLLTYRFIRTPAAEGVQVIAPIGSLDNPEYLKATELLERAGVVADLIALNSYAAVQTWAEAVRRAGSGDPRSVVEVLQSGTIDTAVGPVAFDLRGDRRGIQNSPVVLKNGHMKALATGR